MFIQAEQEKEKGEGDINKPSEVEDLSQVKTISRIQHLNLTNALLTNFIYSDRRGNNVKLIFLLFKCFDGVFRLRYFLDRSSMFGSLEMSLSESSSLPRNGGRRK